MDVPTLPNALESIKSLNKNNSRLHVEGQIPTIYFSASSSYITILNELAKNDLVSMDMVYIT